MTSTGRYSSDIRALPGDIPSLLKIVRGQLVHGDHLDIYGYNNEDFRSSSRQTLPLENRLAEIFRICDEPLMVARPVTDRQIGTCRDYALMLCGMLRENFILARVRCGFAAYFSANRFDDHWICEYWQETANKWIRVDPQLDDQKCRHFDISFDTANLPDGAFLTAKEAWRLCYEHGAASEQFGHGEATGAWFLWVNLARDSLALKGLETSPWDTWRSVIGQETIISSADRLACDAIARAIEDLEQQRVPNDAPLDLVPFWMLDMSAASGNPK